jgi:hypothetical protein
VLEIRIIITFKFVYKQPNITDLPLLFSLLRECFPELVLKSVMCKSLDIFLNRLGCASINRLLQRRVFVVGGRGKDD